MPIKRRRGLLGQKSLEESDLEMIQGRGGMGLGNDEISQRLREPKPTPTPSAEDDGSFLDRVFGKRKSK